MQACAICVLLLFLVSVYECQEPPPVANAYRKWEPGVNRSSVTYECFETYDLTEGNLTRTCDESLNFTYTGMAPVCTLNCRIPRNETSAVLVPPNSTHALSRAEHQCLSGFHGSGNTVVYCSQRHGAWNHSGIDCHDPANLLKGDPGLLEIKDTLSGGNTSSFVTTATDGNLTTFVTLTPGSTLTFNISQYGERMGVAKVLLTLRVQVNNNDTHFRCLLTKAGLEYSGDASKVKGVDCQRWDSQKPHKHSFTSDNFFPVDGSVKAAENYCRNPNATEKTPWCFSSDKDVGNQPCSVEPCVGITLSTVYVDMADKEKTSVCTDREEMTRPYAIVDNVGKTKTWNIGCRSAHSSLLPFGHQLKLEFADSLASVSAQLYEVEAFGRPYTEGCGPVRGYWRLELRAEPPDVSRPGTTVWYRCRKGWHYLGGEIKAVCGDNRSWSHPDTQQCTDETDQAAEPGVTVDVEPPASGSVDLQDQSCDAVSLQDSFALTVHLTRWVEVNRVILVIAGGNKNHTVPLSVSAMNGTWSWPCTSLASASGEGTYLSSCPFRPVSDRVKITYNATLHSNNAGLSWKICHIKVLGRLFTSAVECLQTERGQEYKGQWSMTLSGRECQRWDSQHPHPHSYTQPDLFPDPGLYHSHNYCRNPIRANTGEPSRTWPWCYTMDSEKEWEYCPIVFQCDKICRLRSDGFAYYGPMNTAASGDQCVNWFHKADTAEGFPFLRDRYFLDPTKAAQKCRNPHSSMTTLWCFTNRNPADPRPQLCDLPSCPLVNDISYSFLEPKNVSDIPAWLGHPGGSLSVRECWSFPQPHPGRHTRFVTLDGLLQGACSGDLSEVVVFCDFRTAENGSTLWQFFWYNCTFPNETTTATATTMMITTTDAAVSSSSSSSSTISSSSVNPPCCNCQKEGSVNVSQEQMQAALQQIKKELLVDTSKLSATIRKKESAKDSRPSAVTTGSLGVVFIVLVIGFIIGSDMVTAVRFIWQQVAARAAKKAGSSSA